ncbi:MAG: FG-GAP-like repeat-containing protein [Pirellulaceae bacterium]|nr:FG-GAP-like repeat-containing protein [Pirellulaceae bacterium]
MKHNLFTWTIRVIVAHLILVGNLPDVIQADSPNANRLTYLDDFCNPYWPGLDMPKLITPQWVGDKNVECVVTIGIDDMRDPAPYESYLRPILERLKQVDGRAPASILTNSINPEHPQLATWLEEGLSLETHTADHPCPCLQGGRFETAKSTYDRCVDQLASVPGNHPVTFRFPCMDSMNTPSPRGFAEIINRMTPQGNFLQMSSSVCQLFTPDDPALPRDLVFNEDGQDRFARYLPFASFVNKIENYPYPYVIGQICWEFPCMVPDDWQGQNLQGNANRQTAIDYQAAIDAAVHKQGVANLVCHPNDWIGNQLLFNVVDETLNKHGKRVIFLNFREALERINKNLLSGQSIRAADGGDNGVRILDLNNDGYLDVVIGNDQLRQTRVWLPEQRKWLETEFPAQNIKGTGEQRYDGGVRFGIFREDGAASMMVLNESERAVWHFHNDRWKRDDDMLQGLEIDGQPILVVNQQGRDRGFRLRDADGDGCCEVIVGNPDQQEMLRWNADEKIWQSTAPLPEPIVDALGRDAGLRFVDLDRDGHEDLLFSNERRYAIYIYSEQDLGWTNRVLADSRRNGEAVPMVVRNGTNNGAWFANDHMWIQNEDTNRLSDGVDRRSFDQLLGDFQSPPRSPSDGLRSLRTRPGFEVELVAAEPLVKDPIAFDWGPDGRLWVVEMADYPLGIAGKESGGGRIRFLEDTDGDGQYDKSTIFLDGIPFPTGVMPWRDGVLISAAPDIFFAADTDGDGQADRREILYHGFIEGNQQHRVNGFEWGLDNWVYVANGDSGGTVTSKKTGTTVDISGRDLRIRPDSGVIDLQSGFTQFGRHRDDWGNWFGCSNSLPLRHYVLADHYLRRNPHARPPTPHRDIVVTGNAQVFPLSRILSHWEGYRSPGIGEPHRFTSACSTMPYRDQLFGPDFYQNTYTCEPIHNLVHRRRLIQTGISFASERDDDETKSEFLASTDSWFRPTMAKPGPDGALWIADMYRLVIEHTQYIDDQREKELDLRAGEDRGRIYRVYPRGEKLRTIPKLEQLETEALVAKLDSPSGWQRDTVQRLLIHRADPAAITPLRQMLKNDERPLARLHALCTLDGLDGANTETLIAALSDSHPAVQRHAVRVSEKRLAASPQLTKQLIEMASRSVTANPNQTGGDAQLQLQLAYSLGISTDPEAGKVLGRLAMAEDSDQYLRAAVISSLNELNLPLVLAEVTKTGLQQEQSRAFFSDLLELAAAFKSEDAIEEAIRQISRNDSTDDIAAWQFGAMASLLAGLGNNASPDAPLLATVTDRIHSFREQAKMVAADPNAPLPLRHDAVRLLGRSHRWAAPEDVQRLADLLEPTHADSLQRVALEALSYGDDAEIASSILGRIPSMSPALRAQSLDQLLSRTVWIELLLNEVAANRLPAGEIGTIFQTRLLTHQDESLRKQAESVFVVVNNDRQAVINAYRPSLVAKGNSARGELLFAKQCGSCHRIGQVGKEVGPDLTAITDRSPATLLTAVLDPNRSVEDKYRGYSVLTDDGRVQTGIIPAETSTTITLKNAQGEESVILRSEIDSLRSTGLSLMPTGLEKEIDKNQMADLLSFLGSLRPAPKSFEGNQPQQVKQGTDGTIELTAADCRIYGDSLVFESRYGNLGFWQSATDVAEWLVEVSRAGSYDVIIDYACDSSTANNTYALTIGLEELVGKVEGTGTWDDYRTTTIGQVTLNTGPQHLVFRPEQAPAGCLIDLRAVILKPTNGNSESCQEPSATTSLDPDK